MPVRTVKTNLWPFGSAKTPRPSARKSSMTVAAAMSAAYKAGKASGDTGLFDSWLESKGLEDRSDTLKNRLRKEYERGHETNYSGGSSTESHEQRLAAKGLKYKGYTIREIEGGYSTSLDRESVHDSVKDAKDFIDDHKRNPAGHSLQSAKAWAASQGTKLGREHHYGDAPLSESTAETWVSLTSFFDAPKQQRAYARLFKSAYDKAARKHHGNPPDTQEFRNALAALRRAVNEQGGTIRGQDGGTWGVSFQVEPPDGRGMIGYLVSPEGKITRSWITSPEEYDRMKRRKRNPESSADSAFESFHGEPPKETVIIEEQIHEHEHLWNCGQLIEMVIDTLTGKEVTFSFDGDAPYLSCSEDGAQLYIEGGDQTIDLKAIGMDGKRWVKDRMVIGTFAEPRGSRKWNITYRTKKDFDKFEEIDYQHWLGEPSKELRNPSAPLLEYDPRSQKLYISGGQYIIKKPIFGTSPGIEN